MPRIVMPTPHSEKADYNARAIPQYERAVRAAGGELVVVPAEASPSEVARIATGCQAVLLPGSPADVDPQKYGAARDPQTNPADPRRDMVDELLIQDAYNLRKPILGVCYGLQILNVWRSGSLMQHIEPAGVNHQAGREVARAHRLRIESGSVLGSIVAKSEGELELPSVSPGEEVSEDHGGNAELPPSLETYVNSSHHQAVEMVGDGLRVVARCAEDGLIEALESSNPAHFVLGVQWHPERTYDSETLSRALFRAMVEAAERVTG